MSSRAPGPRFAARAAAIALAMALTAAGCDEEHEAGDGRPELKVSGATSLRPAFEAYGRHLTVARARFSFAGSDELAAQIRQGARPDVYAAANRGLPQALFAEGLVERPVTFATSRLVLAVPTGSTRVRRVEDLRAAGIRLAIGSPSVPIGSYTRKVLLRMGPDLRRAALRNVRSEEPDAGGIVGKLAQGAVDAGFVYVTDVAAAGGRLRAIELPPRARLRVEYAVAVVKGAKQPAAARRFIEGLLGGAGAEALRSAGFEPPPPRRARAAPGPSR